MSKETLKLLLEALGYVLTPHGGTRAHVWNSDEARFVVQAYKVLEEALAKQEQGEPVAWMKEGWGPDCGPYIEFYRDDEMGWRDRKEWTPLYTKPQPAQKPLTDEQITEIFSTTKGLDFYLNFARAIEAAHGIKE